MKPGNRSNATVWSLLVICGILIVGAMAWLTHGVLESERERSLAEARADLEERIRLSLWRMDGAASTVTIEENQRMSNPGIELPANPFVRLRFRVGPDGKAVASQPCEDNELEDLNQLLAEDGSLSTRYQQLCTAVHSGGQQWAMNDYYAKNTEDPQAQTQEQRYSLGYQTDRSMKERAARGKTVNMALEKAGLAQQMAANPKRQQGDTQVELPQTWGPPLAVFAAAFQPAWLGDEAFLLRQVQEIDPTKQIEGIWLKTEDFRAMLLAEVADLLPHADLQPAEENSNGSNALTLASFPWKLVPQEAPTPAATVRGPVVTSLTIGWVAVLIALVAGAALVQGIMKLSERRASFVSAVTHELRTPLTTFRLYSDMLESGSVTEESKRTSYFRTLRREADRLSHLVENVLAFSRIERRPTTPTLKSLAAAQLFEDMRERFEERLEGAGMTLVVDAPEDLRLKGDPTAIEHVLFNLVDNAAKYAAGGDPPEVHLSAEAVGNEVEILVRDFGPGIPESECKEVFRAFHKSAQEAAETRPGVGLGLALSKRLAQGIGGTLKCRRPSKGVCFVLALEAA